MQDPKTVDAGTAESADTDNTEAMMANLQKGVAAWNKDRQANEGTSRVAIGAPPPRKSATRAARAAAPATAPAAPVAADGKKPPFRMSYDGVSASEHAAYRQKLGAR